MREPRAKRRAAGAAAPKKATPAPAAKAKTSDDDEDASAEHGKLADLKSDQSLPRIKDLQVPSVEQLHKSPVDWLLLKGPNKDNELVVVVKQVFPRPDTLKKLQTALEELRHRPAPTTQAEREKRAAQRNELSKLVVTLPGEGDAQLYEIPTNVVDSIIYHEDLIIRRAGMLIDAEKFRDAFELLFPLAGNRPTGRGSKTRLSGSCSSKPSVPSKPRIWSRPSLPWRNCTSKTATTRNCKKLLGEVVDQADRPQPETGNFAKRDTSSAGWRRSSRNMKSSGSGPTRWETRLKN